MNPFRSTCSVFGIVIASPARLFVFEDDLGRDFARFDLLAVKGDDRIVRIFFPEVQECAPRLGVASLEQRIGLLVLPWKAGCLLGGGDWGI